MQKIQKKDISQMLIPVGVGILIMAVVTMLTQNVGVAIIIGAIVFTWQDNNMKMKIVTTKIDNLSKKKEILDQNAP